MLDFIRQTAGAPKRLIVLVVLACAMTSGCQPRDESERWGRRVPPGAGTTRDDRPTAGPIDQAGHIPAGPTDEAAAPEPDVPPAPPQNPPR